MSNTPKRLVGLASAAVAFAGLTVLAPPAHAVSTGLVISEVYGAGGNNGALFNADYVELSNPTGDLISLEGTYIHYRSATGGSGGAPAALHGAVPAGGKYLIQMSNTGANGDPLPSPDTTSVGFSMAASGGQVFLLESASPIGSSGDMAASPGVIDMVGELGSTSFETAAAPADASTTQSLTRVAADADNNSTEFAAAAPTPESSVGAAGGTPTTRTIPEIQGTGFESAHAGTDVTTDGVVTAVYATGGLSGFYMQTEGTGGSVDPSTLTASDGIFVYQHTGAITVSAGDSVTVTGLVREFGGETQIAADGADVVAGPAVDPVTATTTTTWPDTDGEREALEGMLYAPDGNFTITDNFPTNSNGELTLAQGDIPLLQPTEVAEPGSAEYDEVEADNAARKIILDDGSTTLFLLAPNQDETPAYISNTAPYRTGATGTFTDDVIFSQGPSGYRFEPLEQVVGPDNAASPYAPANTRTSEPDASRLADQGTPEITVASFNVLNYFTLLGDADNNNVGDNGCTSFNDRAGDGNTVNSGCSQRGAWDPEDLDRQQTKIVAAINALDADVVGLMEIENSAQLARTPNQALNDLVTALNADAGDDVWAANPLPANLPAVNPNEMDVIANAIIYQKAAVARIGPAVALGDQSSGNNSATDEAFANAREPIGQKFAPVGGGEEVLVVVNHFKSKGSAGPYPGDADQGDGQGAGNVSRTKQAEALSAWIPTVQGTTEDVLLIGDFNSYTMEDPMQVLYDAGYTDVVAAAGHDEYSYSFAGLSGSLDHILANDEAMERFTGADIWNVNAVESIAMEYSRFNNHVTDFHDDGPYRSSDHDPVLVGLAASEDLRVSILGTNDFHGRLSNENGSAAASFASSPAAGAAVLAGAVKQLRQANPNTLFAAAGDLIGASTFDSFILKDKPTIDALNEAGLDVSSVGNHEFDKGLADLIDRVLDPSDPEGGAAWEYLAANVRDKTSGDHLAELAPSWMTTTLDGVDVGFVGAVTEELPSLVSPDGIADIQVTDIVQEVNDAADDLKTAGADIIVMLVHEGSGTTNCTNMFNEPATTPFGSIIHGVNDNIDAIVSGHTHLEYNCSFPVAGWAGRDVTERPVVSAGQYGMALNHIVFEVDPTTHEVTGKSQAVLRLKSSNNGPVNYAADPATEAIVAQAIADAGPLGAVPLGEISGPFSRARFSTGSENRGGESTLGNLVAEVQRWATESALTGSAQIAFMNPGGLRDDMVGAAGPFPKQITYRQAANVQPFANTLVNMRMTGAQLKAVLEQQWQPVTASRSFLRLGVSKGFEYTYDPDAMKVLHMWLNGTPIDLGATYSVTVNSFLASGGDNFTVFAQGTNKKDTGKVDLQAMVDYMAEFASDQPLPISFKQQAVGVKFPAGAPASYQAGTDHVLFDLTSLSMTETDAVRDSEVTVKLGGTTLGTFPVETVLTVPDGNSTSKNTNDESGTASVDVVLPASTPSGTATLVVEGTATGTSFRVPVEVVGQAAPPKAPISVAGAADAFKYGKTGLLKIATSRDDATGQVRVVDSKGALVGTATLSGGRGTLVLPAKRFKPGLHTVRLEYLGSDFYAPATGEVTFRVLKAKPKVKVNLADTVVRSEGAKVKVRVVAPDDIPARGKVRLTVMGTGKSVTGKLVKGKVVLNLPKLNTVGKYRVKVKYLGSPLLGTARKIDRFTLVK